MADTYVYVLDQNNRPLMPTKRYGWVRRSLKSGRATVAKKKPFTIRLTYGTTAHTQPVTVGIDPGRTNIGISAVTLKSQSGKVTAEIYKSSAVTNIVAVYDDFPFLIQISTDAGESEKPALDFLKKIRFEKMQELENSRKE